MAVSIRPSMSATCGLTSTATSFLQSPLPNSTSGSPLSCFTGTSNSSCPRHRVSPLLQTCFHLHSISRNASPSSKESILDLLFIFQFSSVAQLCPTLCDPMNCSTPGLPVHHQLPEFTQLMSIESVIPSNHLILCCPLLLLPSIFPSIRVFSNESALRIR